MCGETVLGVSGETKETVGADRRVLLYSYIGGRYVAHRGVTVIAVRQYDAATCMWVESRTPKGYTLRVAGQQEVWFLARERGRVLLSSQPFYWELDPSYNYYFVRDLDKRLYLRWEHGRWCMSEQSGLQVRPYAVEE